MENTSLITKINSLYGLSVSLENLQIVDGGFLSTNFILASNDKKYFLKKYRINKPEKIKETHSIKKYFEENGIPVILPLINNEGQTFFEDDGSIYALFPFINGIHFEREVLQTEAISSLAEMLGKIHLVGRDYTGQVETAFKLRTPDNFIVEVQKYLDIIHSKQEKDSFDVLAEKTLLLRLKLLKKLDYSLESLNFACDHLVHGDYHDKNVFFNSEGGVIYVFDFEKSGKAPRVSEIYRSLDFICLNGSFEEINLSRAHRYLESYSSTYPIEIEELYRGLKLYYIKLVVSLWVEKSHYAENNSRMDVFLDGQYKTLQYFSENLETFFKEITI